MKEEEKTIKDLVNKLKYEIKWVHVFMLAFDGNNPRLTNSLKDMIRTFEEMFGDYFWRNVVFIVTKWGYSDDAIRKRKENGDSEESWQTIWNKKFREEKFNVSVRDSALKAYFIDTHYNGNKSQEVSNFTKYTSELYDYATKVKPFECKDIKIALTQLQEKEKELADLRNQIKKYKESNEGQSQKSKSNAQIGKLGTALLVIGGIIGIGAFCLCCVYRGFLERSRDITIPKDDNVDNKEETVNVEQDGGNEEQA